VSDGEFELRRRAVDLANDGCSLRAISGEVGRSREWVRLWVSRFRAEGEAGLLDRSRRPHQSPSRLSETVVEEILEVRGLLEADRHANVGPRAIVAEIEKRGVLSEPPSESSIKRVLSAAGQARPYRRRRRSSVSLLGLPQVTTPGVWQQADWVQDRLLTGGVRFSSLQIGDVGSHMISSGQHLNRTVLAAVRQLTEQAWPQMSIGLAMGTDNAFSKTSHRNNPWTLWIRVLLLFGVEAIIAPPNSLGFNNHAEAVNWLWQDRTHRRHHYNTFDDLTEDNTRFLTWANTARAILDPNVCGTRYPAEYTTLHATNLRWIPTGFTIDDYLDTNGVCHLPLARGRVTFLRNIGPNHTIEIANAHWTVPTTLPQAGLVVAAINTATGHLEIRHRGDLVSRHDYPTPPTNTDPYHPPPTTGLLDHLPTMS
jgi:transposase